MERRQDLSEIEKAIHELEHFKLSKDRVSADYTPEHMLDGGVDLHRQIKSLNSSFGLVSDRGDIKLKFRLGYNSTIDRDKILLIALRRYYVLVSHLRRKGLSYEPDIKLEHMVRGIANRL
jgi:hypothetical protein